MPDGRGGPWRRGGGRPPGWPDGESWPPVDGVGWRRVRRRFLWRFVAGAAVAIIAAGLLFSAVGWLVGRAFGGEHGLWFPGFAIPIVFVVLVLLLALRALRRTAVPLGDLIGAAERIERGDFTGRVPERGSEELRSLARAFNAMTARLEANEAARQHLFADVSHELRTPLAVIQGNLEGILDGVYPADAEHLAPILDETRLLARLIDDLRTLSLAEGAALRLERGPHDVRALLDDVVSAFRPQAQAAELRLVTRVAEDLPLVDVDAQRVREVLANLVTNALRATASGGRLELTASSDGGFVSLEVNDTGSGIDAELLPAVFERFSRARTSGGSGLGLAISRSLVEAHGGRINAESEPGRGTTIRFTLPVAH
jgi:signal transduction histidine kinase